MSRVVEADQPARYVRRTFGLRTNFLDTEKVYGRGAAAAAPDAALAIGCWPRNRLVRSGTIAGARG
ncbi:MAG: hypothetical protein Q8M88_04020 [Phenylobacterium sp.]|uniref:hypothetical protein n=1 Tax=Phenylobacterium sp. TaxID=1871053 RepID=UPI0027354806|nr:hypothetical protein [Phenylobacterium sp.]MDP3173581.1 hypothetical protein [Phenylobacterium sp.]